VTNYKKPQRATKGRKEIGSSPEASPMPPERAFVVQFGQPPKSELGWFSGRVEHMMSGQHASFADPRELTAFFRRVMNQHFLRRRGKSVVLTSEPKEFWGQITAYSQMCPSFVLSTRLLISDNGTYEANSGSGIAVNAVVSLIVSCWRRTYNQIVFRGNRHAPTDRRDYCRTVAVSNQVDGRRAAKPARNHPARQPW
jgi:hypothetical protein